MGSLNPVNPDVPTYLWTGVGSRGSDPGNPGVGGPRRGCGRGGDGEKSDKKDRPEDPGGVARQT